MLDNLGSFLDKYGGMVYQFLWQSVLKLRTNETTLDMFEKKNSKIQVAIVENLQRTENKKKGLKGRQKQVGSDSRKGLKVRQK